LSLSATTSPDQPASASRKPSGLLSFTLHAHLPWVVNHGTWPHGIEWLHEAAAETYLPLLRVLGRLERDGLALRCNLNISPILLEQLAHPVFRSEFPQYLERKIVAAREDEAYFASTGENHYAETARFWHRFFTETLADFRALDGNITQGFRHFHERGLIEIITCAATHGYLPLLGTDESVRAQVRTAVDTHIRHIGSHPRGIWSPECGYRPAGHWDYPVPNADGSPAAPGFDRAGIEQVLSESGLDYFFVDSHLIEESARTPSPYGVSPGSVANPQQQPVTVADARRLYQPYFVAGPYDAGDKRHAVTVFPRDPRTGLQVWSGENGYPGEPAYLDFHKKRWPGGHRYWRVTGGKVDMANKEPYDPAAAAQKTRDHAAHFVQLVGEVLQAAATAGGPTAGIPPVLCAPFDAELFGHWWFEGPLWLEEVARRLATQAEGHECSLALITGSDYLALYPRAGFLSMPEGSWGSEGRHHVWMNPETSWTWTHIYPAELFTREVCTGDRWREHPLAGRIAKQLCRELLLLESSDWQFLITTGAARDYAEQRFHTHNGQFNDLQQMWHSLTEHGSLSEEQTQRLTAMEERDSIFPNIDPGYWATGVRQHRTSDSDKL
jgi:1,4-alpha-glucan branching enzyme